MGLFGKKKKPEEAKPSESILGEYYTLEDLQPVFCGNSGITLSPLGAAQAFDEHYPMFISTLWKTGSNIQRFFPSLDLSTEDSVKKFMLSACVITEQGEKFAYVITVNHIPAGMFIITTPHLNEKKIHYNHWTMDFFLFGFYEGKGVMTIAMPRMLLLLKNIGIDDIHFIVDESNTRCLNLLAKFPIDEIDNSSWHNTMNGQRPRVFSCPLSIINFQHR